MDEIVENYLKYFIKEVKYDLKRNLVKCHCIMTLENIGFTRIGIILWKKHIYDEIKKICPVSYSPGHLTKKLSHLDIFEKEIMAKVSQLNLSIYCEKALRKIVSQIGNEIARLFYVINGENNCVYEQFIDIDFLQVYLQNICFVQQGTIDKYEMAVQFVNNTAVDPKVRYLLACNYCLEDKIWELHTQLPEDFINWYLEDKDDDNHVEDDNDSLEDDNDADPYKRYKSFRLVLFWTFFVRGEPEMFCRFTDGEEINQYLLHWSIFNRQEAAVEYIWENFADENMKQHVVSYAYFALQDAYNYNIAFYFLTKMDQQELLKVRIRLGFKLFDILLCHSKWHKCLVPSLKVMEHLIHAKNAEENLLFAISLLQESMISINTYRNILNEYVLCHEQENVRIIFINNIDKILVRRNDELARRILLEKYTSEHKKEILYENNIMNACASLILSGKFDVLDQFVNEMVETAEEAQKFKETIVSNYGNDIGLYFIERNQYNLLDKFLEPCSKMKIMKFKLNLPFRNNSSIITVLLWIEDGSQLSVDKFLRWCCGNDKNLFIKFKSILFDLDLWLYWKNKKYFFNRIKSLSSMGEWTLIEDSLKWIYFAVEEAKINTWEEKLRRINNIIKLSEINNYGSLKRFVKFCLKQSEIDALKNVPTCNKELQLIIKSLLQIVDYSEKDSSDNFSKDSLSDNCSKDTETDIYNR